MRLSLVLLLAMFRRFGHAYFHSKVLNLAAPRMRSTCLSFSRKLDIRPTIDDIERISKGQAAKRRGTGSRQVPHRLNNLERKEWDLAKKRRFLLLRGTGWRKERGDSPLANIYRNYCDAVGVPSINVVRAIGVGELVDQVIVDFSPLRTTEVQQMAAEMIDMAKTYNSFQTVNDCSDPKKLGWEAIDSMLENDVIWRVPVFSIVAAFGVRAEARRFAEAVAMKYANGAQVSINNDDDVGEDEFAVFEDKDED